MTRTVGIILIAVAAGICLLGTIWLGVNLASDPTKIGGAVLGLGLLLVFLVAPLAGGGIFALVKGRQEQSEQAIADAQRKILDMVKAKGEVDISELIIELHSDLETVQGMIHKLVGMGVFSGYINWDTGVLYSSEASALHELQQCKHCGGKVEFAGKGVLRCPHCGTEYFLAT
jgi:hypothetical protein